MFERFTNGTGSQASYSLAGVGNSVCSRLEKSAGCNTVTLSAPHCHTPAGGDLAGRRRLWPHRLGVLIVPPVSNAGLRLELPVGEVRDGLRVASPLRPPRGSLDQGALGRLEGGKGVLLLPRVRLRQSRAGEGQKGVYKGSTRGPGGVQEGSTRGWDPPER
eukprot:7069352-Pyramimonas_sp.AAC.1